MSTTRECFAKDELAEVLSHYNVGVITAAHEFARGSRRSPKLVLETAQGRYLLKRRASGRDDPFRVAFAHALIAHLRKRRFPVPALIGTCDDQNSMLQLRGRVYELFEFVEGDRFDHSLEQTGHAGRTLAKFHAAVADFVTDWKPPRGSYHDAPNVRAGLNAIPTVTSSHDSVIGHEAELLHLTQWLHERYDEAAARVNNEGFHQWPASIIHGDWHPGNMLFGGGRVLAIVDLDAARQQPEVVDVAYGMLQFSILRGASPPDHWPAYFDMARMRRFYAGYRARAHLTPAQRRAIASLMVEALMSEAVLPIAATGSFAQLPGFGVLQMVARKIRWLQSNATALEAWIVE